jgi:L-seryl-tRNA(Ser) seleniumtransferase
MEKPHAHGTHPPAMRDLPSVDYLLRHPAVAPLSDEFSRDELALCIRSVLDQRRDCIRTGHAQAVDATTLALDIRRALYERTRPRLRKVINATGIVLHTGLGRAPLADEAIEAIQDVAAGYCNLEIDLESGERGDRHDHLRDALRELTGSPDALVVNNNAAATFLALNTLARGRGAIISRGQLVEIGGSYRMPDIMAAAGCRMVEVGTTNRTHAYDYQRAIDADTAVFLHVHTSNYRVRGFTTTPTLAELVRIARSHPGGELLVIDDLGSGLIDRPAWAASSAGQWDEPTVRESVAAGADLTLFSGDKLLGGPQAGILVGRSELIERIRKNPLTRTYRPDKLTLAALEATLRLHRDPATLTLKLPIFRMLAAPDSQIESLAGCLAEGIRQHVPGADLAVAADESLAGGGSLPLVAFKTWVVRVRQPGAAAERIAAALRCGATPVICRVQGGALVFDCRTLSEEEIEAIPAALNEAVAEAG